MPLRINASMSDGLDEGAYLPTDTAIGDDVVVWVAPDTDSDYVELTYHLLKTGPSGDVLAWWVQDQGRWMFSDDERVPEQLRGRTVTDLTVSPQPAPVTMNDLHALTEITDAAIHCYRVRRLMPGTDNVIEGVARSIGDERGNFLRRDQDCRDGYLRVSGLFEYFWPVQELMPQIHEATFVVQRGE